MASKTDILNQALIRIGQERVNAIDDTTSNTAKAANSIFDDTVRFVLREHTWNCCTKRQTLSQSTTIPDSYWAHQYALPADLIRLDTVNGVTSADGYIQDLYAVENGYIRTDAETCAISYVEFTTNTDVFDSHLTMCIILYLSHLMQLRIGKDVSKAQMFYQMYERELREAKRIDGSEKKKLIIRNHQRSNWVRTHKLYSS